MFIVMKAQRIGFTNGIIASVSYGTNPLFSLPMISAGIGVNSVLFYRYAFAILIYWVWLKFFKKLSLKVSKSEMFSFLFLGLNFSLSSLTLFSAFKYIDSGIACTILFIYPVIVAIIMSLFFKEKLTISVILAIVFTFGGIWLLNNSSENLNILGVVLVLISALMYAIYIVVIKTMKSIKRVKHDVLAFYVMLSGLFVYILNLKFCTTLQIFDRPLFWLCAIGLAVFPTIISLETINVSIKLIGSTKTAILGALEPITAVVLGVLIFHEKLTVRSTLGILLILVGVIIVIFAKKEKKFEKD